MIFKISRGFCETGSFVIRTSSSSTCPFHTLELPSGRIDLIGLENRAKVNCARPIWDLESLWEKAALEKWRSDFGRILKERKKRKENMDFSFGSRLSLLELNVAKELHRVPWSKINFGVCFSKLFSFPTSFSTLIFLSINKLSSSVETFFAI